jgi:hypothetical protein
MSKRRPKTVSSSTRVSGHWHWHWHGHGHGLSLVTFDGPLRAGPADVCRQHRWVAASLVRPRDRRANSHATSLPRWVGSHRTVRGGEPSESSGPQSNGSFSREKPAVTPPPDADSGHCVRSPVAGAPTGFPVPPTWGSWVWGRSGRLANVCPRLHPLFSLSAQPAKSSNFT